MLRKQVLSHWIGVENLNQANGFIVSRYYGNPGAATIIVGVTGTDGKSSGGDGLSIDTDGNLYVAVPSIQSIQVVSPQGQTLGLIRLPEKPSNCAFGGANMKTLYITARQYVYALPMEATGHRFRGAP